MTDCPFCRRDPFHYVDNGVGMEAVAVTCCDLGDLYFRGARPAPDEVTLSWDEFADIGHKLMALYNADAQPQYFSNCLHAGACHGTCESTDCTNYGKVIVVRRCVEGPAK